MLKFIDGFLNSITMYRLVLYGLMAMAILAIAFGFSDVLPYSGSRLLISALLLVSICYFANRIFAAMFRAQRNIESAIITALILFFILAPITGLADTVTMGLIGILSMALKYILAVGQKHVFNPAAIAIFCAGLLGSDGIIWWVGSSFLLPIVVIVGLLVVRKIRRFTLFTFFVGTSLVTILIFGLVNKLEAIEVIKQAVLSWPLLFFASIMLTEPQTTPPKKYQQIVYGILTGLLFGYQFHLGPIYSTPEFALVVGNIFSYLVSSKQRLFLSLKEKLPLAPDIYEFNFSADKKLDFAPGQYLEWTLSHHHPDDRGNRRYFTVASSPTENEIKLGVKINNQFSSSFKKALLAMEKNDKISASQLGGEFVLPKENDKKLVFIAGGIGITPFRSMIKYLVDKNQKRDIMLFYANADVKDFVYQDLLKQAEQSFGLKTIYVATDPQRTPQDWPGKTGYITDQMIQDNAPDYLERIFYLSGPDAMVKNYRRLLLKLVIRTKNIKTDYFPGF